ncbi:MAG TPA: ribonuclease HII [Myxococcota bacterium]|nr:ribonuclease HII [Myxococcota bacterium]
MTPRGEGPRGGRGSQAGRGGGARGADDALPPLGLLRLRFHACEGEPRALGRLLRALAADRRPGARVLAALVERRLTDHRRERRRVAALFALRRALFRDGARAVAGVDEVGMGPLAGPVVACAVVLPERVHLPGLDDSKRLVSAERERLAAAIRASAVSVGVAEVWPEEIDRRNIYRAGLEAMRRAVAALAVAPDHVLVDARTIPDLAVAQTALVGGDARDGSIAAASIVAKVHRDALMLQLDAEYPGYGFAQHKGYATASHLRILRRRGPSPIHRRSFTPVSQPDLFAALSDAEAEAALFPGPRA